MREPDYGMPDFPLGLTMGMMLSIPMILVGAWLAFRGIYYPQMRKLDWIVLVLRNFRTLGGLVVEGVSKKLSPPDPKLQPPKKEEPVEAARARAS